MDIKIKKGLVFIFLVAIMLASLSGGLLGQGKKEASPNHYQHFSRGINLPFWFWLNEGELKPLQERFSDKDLKLIKKLGFTFVRIPVDMAKIYDPASNGLLNPEALKLLLDGIQKVIEAGLAVNFDLHSISQKEGGSDYSGPLGKDPVFTRNFFIFWEKLAEKLAIFDPDWLLVEPMNEPVFEGQEEHWPPIQKELIAVIRKRLPKHTILATGAFWSNLSTLLKLEPLDDPDIWYCFHF
ncbi:MAG: glycoside hydrolase family 5 protein, partial [Candidatus Saccharicenans sp.]